MKISSPMATGNGAYVVHRMLAEKIDGYCLHGYNPYLTLCPPLLPLSVPKEKTDLIHTTPDYSIFFRKRNTPLVVTFHGFYLDSFMNKYNTLGQRLHYNNVIRFLTSRALKSAKSVTVVSRFLAEIVKDEMGYPGEIRTIYNGIDVGTFYPAKDIKKNNVKVLFCGNLTKRKGADLLPLIADRLNAGIEILYTTGLMDRKQNFSSSRLINIGSVPFVEMAKVYHQADILLFPTVREGFGLVAAEAMACGLPVVATNCSSLPELIINGKGGFLCKLGDADEFAEKINLLADSPNLRREMGQFNRARVEEKFTVDQMVGKYKNLFEEVLDKNLRGV